MLCRSCRPASPVFVNRQQSLTTFNPLFAVVGSLVLLLTPCRGLGQDQSPPAPLPQEVNADISRTTITIPAGTQMALVLTHPIQSRYVHHGDEVYAAFNFPVNSGNQVVIPAGTLIEGRVAKLERKGGRGFLHLEAMSLTFPDGYVAPIPGEATLQTGDGYALRDPGSARVVGAVVAPAAGAGLGALIGHSVAPSQGGTLTASVPFGCTPGSPGCLSSSMPLPPDKGKDTVIGAAIGGAIGAVASITVIFTGHNFFVDAGSPADMVLQQPLVLQQERVAEAVRQSQQNPPPVPPVAKRPVPPPPPQNPPEDHGTCYTPGTPGTPPTVMPGVPGPDGVPGSPTIIPGTPPTPGTPYPCP